MARARARLTGQKEMIGKIGVLAGTRRSSIGNALRAEIEIETTEAKRITPVDTSALVNSIHAVGPRYEGNTIKCSIVAGGDAKEYAVIVHEDLDADHSRSKNSNGQAKFIEQPLFQSKPYIAARIAKRVKRGGL